MKKKILLIALPFVFILPLIILIVFSKPNINMPQNVGVAKWWDIQSVDTMKYSRDIAREKAKDISFDEEIDTQIRLIANTGATHVSIGTPYAAEFVPFLKRWVTAARKYNLKVWFRGNVPGWEGWFGYEKIDRDEHVNLVREFILANGDLFAEGDIFSSCPECENGGPGDPRKTGDVTGHREFLIEEYKATNDAFRKIGKNVRSNFAPMNGDVANLIMNKDTTRALGGIVVIDHYVGSQEKLAKDIKDIAEKSGGRVILGEFGAPIPDIHGNFDAIEQSVWIEDAFTILSTIEELGGVNYWTGIGGSTRLWEHNYEERPAVRILTKFYKPRIIIGVVINEAGEAIKEAKVSTNYKSVTTGNDGNFSIPILDEKVVLKIEADNYYPLELNAVKGDVPIISLVSRQENLLFKLRKIVYDITRSR